MGVGTEPPISHPNLGHSQLRCGLWTLPGSCESCSTSGRAHRSPPHPTTPPHPLGVPQLCLSEPLPNLRTPSNPLSCPPRDPSTSLRTPPTSLSHHIPIWRPPPPFYSSSTPPSTPRSPHGLQPLQEAPTPKPSCTSEPPRVPELPPFSPFSPIPFPSPPPEASRLPLRHRPGPLSASRSPAHKGRGVPHWQHPSTPPLAETPVTQGLPRSPLAAARRQSAERREEGGVGVGGAERPPEENSGRVVGGGADAPHRPSFPPGLPQRHRGGLTEHRNRRVPQGGPLPPLPGPRAGCVSRSGSRLPSAGPGPLPPKPPPALRTEISRDLRGGDAAAGTNGGTG